MMTQAAARQLLICPAEPVRSAYLKRARHPLRNMPQIIKDINEGHLQRGRYVADSVCVSYIADDVEMFAIIHGASNLGFARKMYNAALTPEGAAKLSHVHIKRLLGSERDPFAVHDVDRLVNEDIVPREKAFAVVMTREHAKSQTHGRQSREDAKVNQVGIAMSGNRKEWCKYVTSIPSGWYPFNVTIPIEVRRKEPYGDHALVRPLRIGYVNYDGLGAVPNLGTPACFVELVAGPQQKAPATEVKTADRLYNELKGLVAEANESQIRKIFEKYFK